MFYRGQRLVPSSLNPILYAPHDFAIFEGLEGDRLVLTLVQRRQKTEPVEWWTPRIEKGQCHRRCLALYRTRVQVSDVLSLLHEHAPALVWIQNAPLNNQPLNPYRFQGFFGAKSKTLELDPEWVNNISDNDLRAVLFDLARGIEQELCQ